VRKCCQISSFVSAYLRASDEAQEADDWKEIG